MIAALGMYDRPETRAANEALWDGIKKGIRAQGLTAPKDLTHGDLAFMAGWTSPNLIFSQTCSLPYRTVLQGKVSLIATPDYDLPDCPAGYYRSVYVTRSSDPRRDLASLAGSAFALNEGLSHSGWAAPWADHMARGLTLSPALQTGSHRASGFAVAKGEADYAALDQLTWELMCRYDDFAQDLRVVDQTPCSPALPYITAKTNEVEALHRALDAAITALSTDHRTTLRLKGIVTLPSALYLALPIPPAPFAK